MFVASIAHILAFPITPYKLDQTQTWWWNIAHAANPSDFNSEVQIHANHFYGKLRTALANRRSRSASVVNLAEDENARLLSDDELIRSVASDGPVMNSSRIINDEDDDPIQI